MCCHLFRCVDNLDSGYNIILDQSKRIRYSSYWTQKFENKANFDGLFIGSVGILCGDAYFG